MHHPNDALKALCKATGLTQRQFASRIGIPYRTLVMLMVGQRRLTKDKAELMMVHTGVLPESIMGAGDYDEALAVNGDSYTPEFFKSWESQMTMGVSKLDRETSEKAAIHLRRLQELAQKKQRLVAIQYLFQQWLESTLKAFKWERAFSESFKDAPHLADGAPIIQIKHRRVIRCGRTTAGQVAAKKRNA
jgi:hypothetical protein